MEPADIGGKLMGEDAGLAKTAMAIGGVVTLQVRLEDRARLGIARLAFGKIAARLHAFRIVLQIFREIEDIGLDALMDGMALGLLGMAQGDDQRLDAAILQPGDLLSDEGLRQARIALDENGDASGHG